MCFYCFAKWLFKIFYSSGGDLKHTVIQVSHTHPIQLTPIFDTYKVLPSPQRILHKSLKLGCKSGPSAKL